MTMLLLLGLLLGLARDALADEGLAGGDAGIARPGPRRARRARPPSSPPASTATSTRCSSSAAGASSTRRSYKQDYDKLFVGKGAPGIYNYYDPGWHPYYKRTKLHTMQSVSKSVTSALIGIAIGRKEIPGVDAKMMPYFSAFQIPPDPRRDRMTLRDVLTMTTGIRWDEESTEYTDPANNCAVMEGKAGLGPVRPRAAHGRGSRQGLRLQQRRDDAALRADPEDDREGGRRLREGAPLRPARHRVLLEAHAEGPRRHGGRAVPRAAGPREVRIPVL